MPTRSRQDAPSATPPRSSASTSSRWVVVAFVVGVLMIWLGLDRAFRGWKARYEALAEFGASKVAPAVDPLAETVPTGVEPADWRVAVAETHAMLLALTASGALDESGMDDLRRDVDDRVARARARPETARSTLAQLWDDLERRAGPLIAPDSSRPEPNSRRAPRHPRPPRPRLLGPPEADRPGGPDANPTR